MKAPRWLAESFRDGVDKHLVSLPSEEVVVPYSALPEHVLEFASEWGLENELEAKFPVFGRKEAA